MKGLCPNPRTPPTSGGWRWNGACHWGLASIGCAVEVPLVAALFGWMVVTTIFFFCERGPCQTPWVQKGEWRMWFERRTNDEDSQIQRVIGSDWWGFWKKPRALNDSIYNTWSFQGMLWINSHHLLRWHGSTPYNLRIHGILTRSRIFN